MQVGIEPAQAHPEEAVGARSLRQRAQAPSSVEAVGLRRLARPPGGRGLFAEVRPRGEEARDLLVGLFGRQSTQRIDEDATGTDAASTLHEQLRLELRQAV